jgi:pentose-5-phosphate-3-epimerase
MSVNPGASGQAFILGTFEKINELIDWQKKNHASLNITVDGGVNESNIKQLKELNVTAVAVTNGLFNNFDPIDNFNKLKKLTE